MLGTLVTSYPRRILGAMGLLFVLCGVFGAGAIDALALNRFEAPDSESVRTRELLSDTFGTSSPNVAVLVGAESGTVDDARIARVGEQVTSELDALPGVRDAWSYWSPNAPATLASEDRSHALVLAWVPGDADRVRGDVLPRIQSDVIDSIDASGVRLTLGGGDEIFRVVAEQARADFVRAELLVLPLVGLLLWLIYRRWALALITLGVGIFSVVGTLSLLRLVTTVTEVSTFASNIALVMGIGLGVDYCLFVVYRFREELAAGHEVFEAVRRTTRRAGRTVVFSGLTVAASLSALFVFPYPFLSSFAYAGIAVVASAILGSLLILPAALALLGRRAERRGGAGQGGSFWFRVSTGVLRRPLLAGGAGLIVLLALGAPAAGVNFGSPDDRVLNADVPVRAMYDVIREDFTTEDADAIHVVAPDADRSRLDGYAAGLSELPGVLRVDSAAGRFTDGDRIGRAGPVGPERFAATDGREFSTWLAVVPTGQRLAEDPIGLVADVRALDAPFEVSVGGYPAELADYRDGVVERLPAVAAVIVLVTFVLLFLMTGSVLAPVKAAVLNLLSLSVMFGVLVWGFQEGWLAGPLGFTPTGAIEPSIPMLMFCIAYGLSMDYEVFLLSRIKEDYDRTADPIGSIPRGIGSSGGLVTAAALTLAVSFALYATSEVAFLQQLGIGMAITVAVDATVIRGVLVPALMGLAGRANWWAPGPLRRLYDRVGQQRNTASGPGGRSS